MVLLNSNLLLLRLAIDIENLAIVIIYVHFGSFYRYSIKCCESAGTHPLQLLVNRIILSHFLIVELYTSYIDLFIYYKKEYY